MLVDLIELVRVVDCYCVVVLVPLVFLRLNRVLGFSLVVLEDVFRSFLLSVLPQRHYVAVSFDE